MPETLFFCLLWVIDEITGSPSINSPFAPIKSTRNLLVLGSYIYHFRYLNVTLTLADPLLTMR